MRCSPRRRRRSQRTTATATDAATVGASRARPSGIAPAARPTATGSGASTVIASVVEPTSSATRSPEREATQAGMASQKTPPAAVKSVVGARIRRMPDRGSILRRSGATAAGCQRNPSTSKRTARDAPAATTITASVGSTRPSDGQKSNSAWGARRAGAQAAWIDDIAADSVARHQAGRRRTVTATPAPQAGSAAVGSMPSRSASWRRRLVAGRVRSEASLIGALRSWRRASPPTAAKERGRERQSLQPASAGGADRQPATTPGR